MEPDNKDHQNTEAFGRFTKGIGIAGITTPPNFARHPNVVAGYAPTGIMAQS